MERPSDRLSGSGSDRLTFGKTPALLVGGGLALAVATLAGVPYSPSRDDVRPAQGTETAFIGGEPSAAAVAPFTSGDGRPLASREIGAVLSILFRDPSAEQLSAKAGPASGEAASAVSDGVPRDAQRIRSIQSRLSALGYPSGEESGVWGPRTRQALREFKTARQLQPDDAWDQAAEKALTNEPVPRRPEAIAGVWAPDAKACSPQTNRKGLLPAVINHEGAWAGDVSCSFRNGRRDGEGWRFTAACSGARKRWTASVKLTVAGDVLTWSSERGSQRYVRCSTPT